MSDKRRLISKNEDKVSYVQIIGFGLIAVGIVYLSYFLLPGSLITFLSYLHLSTNASAEGMSISFFIIMLGVSFAFPELLQDQTGGLSTMRIAAFMVVNLFCLLAIKIGWSKNSFAEIGINQYWVGILAFAFGAKATQSFFESKMAMPAAPPQPIGMASVSFTNANIATLAVAQNQQSLKVKFPNILSVSDAVNDLASTETHVVAIYLKDNNTAGIPDKLQINMPDGSVKTISTEIIKNLGVGKLQVSQQSEIETSDDLSKGSVCCVVDTNLGFNAAVTAGHVYSKDASTNCGGVLPPSLQTVVKINEQPIGTWFFQVIDYKNDVALIKFAGANNDPQYVSLKGYYEVSDNDVKKTAVTLVSKSSGRRTGYILDYYVSISVPYADALLTKNNIVLIGNTTNRDSSITLSKGGDSGGCVYEPASMKLIGIILGGDDKFTWVLPLEEIFNQNDLKLL